MYSRLSTRNDQGLRGVGCECSHRTGMGAAGALSASDAVDQALKLYSGQHINPKSVTDTWKSDAASIVASGEIPVSPPFGPSCSGVQTQPMNLLKTASGFALSATGAATGIAVATQAIAATTGAIIGAATFGVGAIISIIVAIFQHHAQAVARDLQFGCSALPAVNNALAVIDQAVQDGSMAPADAASALPEIYSQFMAAGGASGSGSGPGGIPGGGAPINDSPFCNSNCELSIVVLAIVLYRQSEYQNMAAPASSAAAAGQTGAAAPSSNLVTAGLLLFGAYFGLKAIKAI